MLPYRVLIFGLYLLQTEEISQIGDKDDDYEFLNRPRPAGLEVGLILKQIVSSLCDVNGISRILALEKRIYELERKKRSAMVYRRTWKFERWREHCIHIPVQDQHRQFDHVTINPTLNFQLKKMFDSSPARRSSRRRRRRWLTPFRAVHSNNNDRSSRLWAAIRVSDALILIWTVPDDCLYCNSQLCKVWNVMIHWGKECEKMRDIDRFVIVRRNTIQIIVQK